VTAGRGWYRGDCHVHSVYSDGQLTVGQLAAGARAAGLDFIATTEHNTADAHGAWQAHDGGGLLVILGEEVTTAGGHWLALGLRPGQLVDWRYRAEDQAIGRQLDQVHDVGGLCVVAHPHAPYPGGSFTYPYQGFDAVEVWNGQWTSDRPWNADNEAALAGWARSLAAGAADGRWRPALGSSDTHLEGQLGTPQLDRRIGCRRAGLHRCGRWPRRRARRTAGDQRPPGRGAGGGTALANPVLLT
jgi:hypothetical protein